MLSGAFLSPGSHAMVVSLSTPGCGVSLGWIVYRQTATGWRNVYEQNNGAFLGKVGSTLRTWQGVLSPDDAHGFPSHWRWRLWHWNGSRMVAGA